MIKERGISMKNKTFTTGVIGTLVTILCCATPILNILLGSVGLASITGYLDYVLIPALAIFLTLAIFSYNKSSKSNCKNDSCCSVD